MVVADCTADYCNLLQSSGSCTDQTDMLGGSAAVDHKVGEGDILDCGACNLTEEALVGTVGEGEAEVLYSVAFTVECAGEASAVVEEAVEINACQVDVGCELIVHARSLCDRKEFSCRGDNFCITSHIDIQRECVAACELEHAAESRVDRNLEVGCAGALELTVLVACIDGVLFGNYASVILAVDLFYRDILTPGTVDARVIIFLCSGDVGIVDTLLGGKSEEHRVERSVEPCGNGEHVTLCAGDEFPVFREVETECLRIPCLSAGLVFRYCLTLSAVGVAAGSCHAVAEHIVDNVVAC